MISKINWQWADDIMPNNQEPMGKTTLRGALKNRPLIEDLTKKAARTRPIESNNNNNNNTWKTFLLNSHN